MYILYVVSVTQLSLIPRLTSATLLFFFLGGKKSLIQMLPNPLLPPIIYFPGVQHMASNALMEAACLHDCLK